MKSSKNCTSSSQIALSSNKWWKRREWLKDATANNKIQSSAEVTHQGNLAYHLKKNHQYQARALRLIWGRYMKI